MESFESPIVTTYRIVVAYRSFCILSRAVGVSMDILLPKPDSTAKDPAMVPPIAITWIGFSLLNITPCCDWHRRRGSIFLGLLGTYSCS